MVFHATHCVCDSRYNSSIVVFSGVTKSGDDGRGKGASSDSNNLRKDLKTIYDMVLHLAGRPIPGIPMNGPLPNDPTERVKQVYWQHNTMLMFIKYVIIKITRT